MTPALALRVARLASETMPSEIKQALKQLRKALNEQREYEMFLRTASARFTASAMEKLLPLMPLFMSKFGLSANDATSAQVSQILLLTKLVRSLTDDQVAAIQEHLSIEQKKQLLELLRSITSASHAASSNTSQETPPSTAPAPGTTRDYRSILAEYAASGPQESVRDAVRALLAAVDTLRQGRAGAPGGVAVTISEAMAVLCQECGNHAATALQDKLSLHGASAYTRDDVTSDQIASFATYPHDLLLDELVMCTVRWNIGPLDADERRIATALLERLATLGIARKAHREGCEIWPKYRLCNCPWEVSS